jgi:quercetin dioxygenase-like cupin family protein
MEIIPERSVTAEPAGETFAGPTWRTHVFSGQPGGLRADRFTYGPGGRSDWHVHEGEQALVVVEGRGLIQWEGLDAPRVLGPGDWVYVEPGVPHWHGAAPDDVFSHLAITASGATDWREPVTEEQYGVSPEG